MRHTQPGTYRAAMQEQRAWSDQDELASLVEQQTWDMRRDGEQPANDLASSDPNAVVLSPRHPRQEPESVYVGPAERVEWVSESKDERAQVEWKPSLVRLGERPGVKHALAIDPTTLLDDIERLRAEMVGRTGKGKVTRKAKLARLLAALDRLTAEPEPEPEPWEPEVLTPAPVVVRSYRQSDYVGWTGPSESLSYWQARLAQSSIEP